jgi:hypothetical protein
VDTTSTFIQLIDENYPAAGKPNDANGFHNNFSSIKSALTNIDAEIQSLKTSSVLSFQDNDFGGYNLTNINLKNSSVTIAPQGNGTLPIDHAVADFWPITLLKSGSNTITVNPITNTTSATGHLIVSITTSSVNTTVSFAVTTGTIVSVGSETQPYDLSNTTPYLFEMWNDYSSDVPKLYIKKLSIDQVGLLNAQTYYQSLGTNAFHGNTAAFTASTITLGGTTATVSSEFTSTVVTDGIDYGTVAVVPNRINTFITETNVALANGMATEIGVRDLTGIQSGATFYLLGTTTQYTVTGPIAGTLLSTTQYDVRHCNIGDPITFVNPQYPQPIVSTFVNTPVANDYGIISTGTSYNLKGSIYADKNNLQVTFDNPNGSAPNTFSISKAITATNTTSNDLVTVGYVNHYIPQGAVIMWYNSKERIPYGWWLCDGSIAPNGITAPNLSNRFVVGATDEYLTTSTIALSTQTFTVPTTNITGTNVVSGGTSTSVLLAHNHIGTGTTVASYDPGHQHLGVGANAYTGVHLQIEGPFPGPDGSGSGPNGSYWWGFNEVGTTGTAVQWWDSNESVFLDQSLPQSEPQNSGIILKTTTKIDNTGTVAANNHANLPPYNSLYFIYKWSGQTFTNGF